MFHVPFINPLFGCSRRFLRHLPLYRKETEICYPEVFKRKSIYENGFSLSFGITKSSGYDPQGSLTLSLGIKKPDNLEVTLANVIESIVNDKEIPSGFGILRSNEGVDFMPANIELSGIEVGLVTQLSREKVLKSYVDTVRDKYDYILIDCMPSLGMMTFNALCAADTVIIPTQPEYLSAKGLEQLLLTISKVKKHINPKLEIDGILLTMTDNRTRFGRGLVSLIRSQYGQVPGVFNTTIPRSVRAAETSAEGVSIFTHDRNGKVAEAYKNLTKEVMADVKQRQRIKNKSEFIR